MASTENSPNAASEDTMKNAPVENKQSTDPNAANSGSEESKDSPPPVRKLSRSKSITTSAIPTNFILPPEMQDQWKKRRESLDNLNLDKVAPWMHLHDFSETEGQDDEQVARSPPHSSS